MNENKLDIFNSRKFWVATVGFIFTILGQQGYISAELIPTIQTYAGAVLVVLFSNSYLFQKAKELELETEYILPVELPEEPTKE